MDVQAVWTWLQAWYAAQTPDRLGHWAAVAIVATLLLHNMILGARLRRNQEAAKKYKLRAETEVIKCQTSELELALIEKVVRYYAETCEKHSDNMVKMLELARDWGMDAELEQLVEIIKASAGGGKNAELEQVAAIVRASVLGTRFSTEKDTTLQELCEMAGVVAPPRK